MSSRTSSRSTLTMVPSTMSPSLKYLIVSSIAARKASSEPMSLTATCGVLRDASVLLVMWERAPVRTLSRRYCHARTRIALPKPDSLEAIFPEGRKRLDNRGDIQQMRARPTPSEVHRSAAQLVAYGGSRARSMREEHTWDVCRIPGNSLVRAASTALGPAATSRHREYATRPMIEESEPQATRRHASEGESSRANR